MLSTQKAELTWVAGYILRWFTCPETVTHPRSNQAWRKATSVTATNALTTTANRQLCNRQWSMRDSIDLHWARDFRSRDTSEPRPRRQEAVYCWSVFCQTAAAWLKLDH